MPHASQQCDHKKYSSHGRYGDPNAFALVALGNQGLQQKIRDSVGDVVTIEVKARYHIDDGQSQREDGHVFEQQRRTIRRVRIEQNSFRHKTGHFHREGQIRWMADKHDVTLAIASLDAHQGGRVVHHWLDTEAVFAATTAAASRLMTIVERMLYRIADVQAHKLWQLNQTIRTVARHILEAHSLRIVLVAAFGYTFVRVINWHRFVVI